MADAVSLDLDACAREPIHIPGSIQPHGALLVLDPADLTVRGASANAAEVLKLASGDPTGLSLGEALTEGGQTLVEDFRRWVGSGDANYLRLMPVAGRPMNIVGHRSSQAVILEFEDAPAPETQNLEALYPRVRAFVEAAQAAKDLASLTAAAAEHMRALTGFDRTLVYYFDEEWNGVVVGESRGGVLPSYLGQRFPASDIPAQARELYRQNRIRLIADANYTPVPIHPPTAPDGRPLDLSFAQLRSVSPVHLEYMRNMGTLSSMSISIVVEGRLWGLISCHDPNPRVATAPVRAACDLLGQVLAMEIGSQIRNAASTQRLALKSVETELLARMAQAEGFAEGLARNPELWLKLANAAGAAVLAGETVFCAGATPPVAALQSIAAWVQSRGAPPVYATASLGKEMAAAADWTEEASGLLAVSVSELHSAYVMWFRPEVVKTVEWAGDPTKPTGDAAGRLNPRKSFETWRDQVRGQSEPWTEAEIEAARDFRTAVIDIVLRRAEERAELTDELQRANKELEAFSYSVSHDLRAPFRHIVGYAELLQDRSDNLDDTSRHYLVSIIDAALSAGRLVDDLLHFSQLGRTRMATGRADMNKLVAEVRRTLEPDVQGRAIEWRVDPLPQAWGDPSMLRQVWANLIGNAVKYSRGREPAVISITASESPNEITYTISDNGAGFDMTYAGKLFGVFQRLHRVDEFEGSGIGLALVQRIIHRHGGRVWADGAVGKGATFSFALPRQLGSA